MKNKKEDELLSPAWYCVALLFEKEECHRGSECLITNMVVAESDKLAILKLLNSESVRRLIYEEYTLSIKAATRTDFEVKEIDKP